MARLPYRRGMRVEATAYDELFAAAGQREADLRRMDAAIVEHAPDLERWFSTGVGMGGAGIGYGTIDYRTKAAKEPTTIPVLGLVPQKRHLALYACVVVDGQYLAEKYAERLGRVSCGKSCIRFTRFDNVDPDGIAALLREVNERYRAGQHLFGH